MICANIINSNPFCITESKQMKRMMKKCCLNPKSTKLSFICNIIIFIAFILIIFVADFEKVCYASEDIDYPLTKNFPGATEQNAIFLYILISFAVIYFVEALKYLQNFYPKFRKIRLIFLFNYLG
jgi:uncharacterized membrane protein